MIEHEVDMDGYSKLIDMIMSQMSEQSDNFVIKNYAGVEKLLSHDKRTVKNYVETRPSKVHGNGVFATEDIPAYTVVTMYPADFVYKPLPDGTADASGEDFQDYHLYGVEHNNSDLVLCGNPAIKNPMFLGHLINDSSFIDGIDAKQLIKYTLSAIHNTNCAFDSLNHVMTIRTTKDIKKGKELFVCYGLDYWANDTKTVQFTRGNEAKEAKLLMKVTEQLKKIIETDRPHFHSM
jgi:SET domain-containing protein